MSAQAHTLLHFFGRASGGAARRWRAPVSLLAVSAAALLGACTTGGPSNEQLAMSGNTLPLGSRPAFVTPDNDTDSRTFIPMEDITRDGAGNALMWRTGTPIPEFGDSAAD